MAAATKSVGNNPVLDVIKLNNANYIITTSQKQSLKVKQNLFPTLGLAPHLGKWAEDFTCSRRSEDLFFSSSSLASTLSSSILILSAFSDDIILSSHTACLHVG